MYFPVCVLHPFHTRDVYFSLPVCFLGPFCTRDESHIVIPGPDRASPGPCRSAASTVRMYSGRDSIAEAAMKWADSPDFFAASTAKVLPEADILSRRSYGHRRLDNEARRLQTSSVARCSGKGTERKAPPPEYTISGGYETTPARAPLKGPCRGCPLPTVGVRGGERTGACRRHSRRGGICFPGAKGPAGPCPKLQEERNGRRPGTRPPNIFVPHLEPSGM